MRRTRVVAISREKYTRYIGRWGRGQDGTFGNPFDVDSYGREVSLELYRVYLYRLAELDPDFKRRLLELEGEVLGCPGNCSPGLACHGDIIIEWLEDWKSGKVGAR